ncbi:MAG TPA: MFS transporter [Conexivisphaerales archaeon]|nr:MFS transporter [Conexivisphaerales archaeon]
MLRGLSRNVKLITLGWILMSIGFSATMPFMAIYLVSERSVPYALAGAVFLAQGLLGLLSQVIAGFIADWAGPRRTMLAGNLVAAAITFVLAYLIMTEVDAFIIIFVYLVFSFLRGLSQPASAALMADDRGDMVTNLSLLTMGANLGFAIGPAAGGFLLDFAGFANLFYLSGAFALATFVVSLPVQEASYFRAKEKHNPRPDMATLLYLILTFLGFLVIGQDIQPFSLYASVFAHQTDFTIGLLFSFSGLVIVVLQMGVARAIRERGIFPLVAASLLAGAVGYFVTSLSRDTPTLFVSMALITLAEILFVVPTQVWVTYRAPETRKGAYQGYSSAIRYTGRSVAAWLGTTALGIFAADPSYAWYVIVVISFVTLGLFYAHHRAYDA